MPYGIFVQKIECANHDCKAYWSKLESLAKDNRQFHGKCGLIKKAIQRLTVGAGIAIATQCITIATQCITIATQCITIATQCITIATHFAKWPVTCFW